MKDQNPIYTGHGYSMVQFYIEDAVALDQEPAEKKAERVHDPNQDAPDHVNHLLFSP